MKFDYKSIILYGALKVTFFLITPLIVILLLSDQGIMEFSSIFITNIIIMGSVGTIITIVRYSAPKDTMTRGIIGIAVTIYNGIYLFYIFGGFTGDLGTYIIQTQNISAVLGLQLIAWILLLGALLKSSFHIVKTIEIAIYKKKNKNLEELRQLKILKGLKIGKLLLNLFLIGFIISVGLSGMNISFNVKESYQFNWDTAETVIDFSDDTIEIITFFDLINPGIYSVLDVIIDIDIYTINTTDITQIFLPDNTKIGEVENMEYPMFARGSLSTDQDLVIDIIPQYVEGLIIFDADLLLDVNLYCHYATIEIFLMTNVTLKWTSLV